MNPQDHHPNPADTADADLPLDRLADRPWDALVVGAGPAGAAAALRLADAGARVLLLDKAPWPRDKVCGGALNASGLATLQRLDARHALHAAHDGPTLRTLRLHAAGQTAAVPLPPGRAVDRAPFDDALVRDAVQRGAAFLPATEAALHAPGRLHLTRRRPDRRPDEHAPVQGRLVIAAPGLRGLTDALHAPPKPNSHIGVGAIVQHNDPDFPPGVIRMVCGRSGYLGISRLAHDRLILAAALNPAAARRLGGIEPTIQHIFDDARLEPPDALRRARWKGTPTLTRRPQRPWAPRLLAVGDAAGYVEPFTGEGMAWALAGGAALADRALEHNLDWSTDLGAAWAGDLRKLLHARHARCRAIAHLLRRPVMLRHVVRLLHLVPALARPLVRAMNRPPRSVNNLRRPTHPTPTQRLTEATP